MADAKLCTCGCCDGVHPWTPLAEMNDPGQDALSYRVGTYGTFNATMHATVSGEPALAQLKTRSADDPTMAVIDAWAVVLDVLTFYQERVVNEGFARTATDRRSLLELARAIGYELRPGVAAGTVLAFNMETAQGAPSQATIPVGTKAQSIPGQNETAQTFETVEQITGRPSWNALKVRSGQTQLFALHTGALTYELQGHQAVRYIFFSGTSTGLQADDLLLIVLGSGASTKASPVRVVSVTTDSTLNRTQVEIDVPSSVSKTLPAPVATTVYDDLTLPAEPTPIPFTPANINAKVLTKKLREQDLQTLLNVYQWNADELVAYFTNLNAGTSGQAVFAMRDRVGFFGNNAPLWDSLKRQVTDSSHQQVTEHIYPTNWDKGHFSIFRDYTAGKPYSAVFTNIDAFLERPVTGIAKGSWTVFMEGATHRVYQVLGVQDASLAGFAVSGKATGLQLGAPHGGAGNKHVVFTVRGTTAYLKSEQLQLAAVPAPNTLVAGTKAFTFDRMVPGLRIGGKLALSGEQLNAKGVIRNEILTIEEIIHYQGYTTVQFHTLPAKGLQYGYRLDSVAVNANVASATHGETRTEVMGGGDASKPWQKFALKQSPLTYVSAATPSGTQSTLVVRANDLLWTETPDFYTTPSDASAFVTRRTDDGKTIVTFGDGTRGKRLPTGVENVTASYRVGIGSGGNVKAGQISMLMSRPLGVKDALNPIPATGGADPESRDDARVNAPLTVLTLDRIVSLQDFEDFARAFAGIGKAQAVWLWDGETKRITITVGSADGGAVPASSQLMTNLRNAIETSRDPGVPVDVLSFAPVFFNVYAKILTNPAYIKENVQAAVTAAVSTAFDFKHRDFGAGVTRSQLEAIMQRVDGVDAVDLDKFFIASVGDTQADILPAHTARWSAGHNAVLPAELLLVNPREIHLSEMIA